MASAYPVAKFLTRPTPAPQKLYALFLAAADVAASTSREDIRSSGTASARIMARKDEPMACRPACCDLQPQAAAIRLLNRGGLELAAAAQASSTEAEPRRTLSPRIASDDDARIRGDFGGDVRSPLANGKVSDETWPDLSAELAPWPAVGPESRMTSSDRQTIIVAATQRPGSCGGGDTSYDRICGVADSSLLGDATQSALASLALSLERCAQIPLQSSPPLLGKVVLRGNVASPPQPALHASGSCEYDGDSAGESSPSSHAHTLLQDPIASQHKLSQRQLARGSLGRRRRLTWAEAAPVEVPSCLAVAEPLSGIGAKCRCVDPQSRFEPLQRC